MALLAIITLYFKEELFSNKSRFFQISVSAGYAPNAIGKSLFKNLGLGEDIGSRIWRVKKKKKRNEKKIKK